jgi:hypothetical protein
MKMFLSVIFALFVFVNLSFGQDYAKQGVTEFSGSLSFTSITPITNGTSRNNSSTFTVAPMVSCFFSDIFQIGIAPTFIFITSGGAKLSTVGVYASPGFVFDLHSSVYPFVSALLGYNYSSETLFGNSGSGIGYGAEGGIKVLIAKDALLNIGLEYLVENLNPPSGSSNSLYPPRGSSNSLDQLQVSVGFSIFVGK